MSNNDKSVTYQWIAGILVTLVLAVWQMYASRTSDELAQKIHTLDQRIYVMNQERVTKEHLSESEKRQKEYLDARIGAVESKIGAVRDIVDEMNKNLERVLNQKK